MSQTLNTRQLPLRITHTGTAQEQYTYDANANLTAIDDQLPNLNNRSMTYDNLDRLITAAGPWGEGIFTYDAIDNLRTTTVGSRSTVASYVSNRLSSLATNGVPSAYTYDSNGNLTARGAQEFAFDIGNRMSAATAKATYAYDGLGRRTWLAYAGGTAKQQIYSQAGQLLYSARSGQAAVRNVYLGAKLIAESNASTGTVFTHTDVLGSVIARTNVSGALLSRTTFEPYGAAANGTAPTGVGFTGHVHDADTALVYMQQRYYDPVAGRFLSVDPVVTDAKTGEQFNRYSYGNNNPYKFKDPNGKFAIVALLPAFVDAVVAAIASNTGAAVVGVAGGVAIGAVVSSPTSQNGNNGAAAAPAAAEGAPAASGAEGPSKPKESGSYTNTHESGKTYDGKGSRERSQESGRRVEGETGDKHTATDWTPAKDSREGFQQESKRLDSNGGSKSDANYNKIESPGKKMREQDAN